MMRALMSGCLSRLLIRRSSGYVLPVTSRGAWQQQLTLMDLYKITWGKARAAAEYNQRSGHVKYGDDVSPYLYSIPNLNYRVLTSAATQNEVEKVGKAAEEVQANLATLQQRVLDKPVAVNITTDDTQQEKKEKGEQPDKEKKEKDRGDSEGELDESNLPIKKRKVNGEKKRKPLFV